LLQRSIRLSWGSKTDILSTGSLSDLQAVAEMFASNGDKHGTMRNVAKDSRMNRLINVTTKPYAQTFRKGII
jgi:hypothetical protein